MLVGGGINVGLNVRNDSPIKSRKEIKGRRIGCKYAGSPAIHVYAEAEIANPGFSRSCCAAGSSSRRWPC